MLTFLLIITGISAIVHWFIRKLAISLPLICLLGGLVNLADEIMTGTGSIRPADLAFWGPMAVMIGAAISLPIATLMWWIFHKLSLKAKS